MTQPRPCEDCVAVHGDDPQTWLGQYPDGAEHRAKHDAWLCDGCADERDEDLSPWSHGFSLDSSAYQPSCSLFASSDTP